MASLALLSMHPALVSSSTGAVRYAVWCEFHDDKESIDVTATSGERVWRATVTVEDCKKKDGWGDMYDRDLKVALAPQPELQPSKPLPQQFDVRFNDTGNELEVTVRKRFENDGYSIWSDLVVMKLARQGSVLDLLTDIGRALSWRRAREADLQASYEEASRQVDRMADETDRLREQKDRVLDQVIAKMVVINNSKKRDIARLLKVVEGRGGGNNGRTAMAEEDEFALLQAQEAGPHENGSADEQDDDDDDDDDDQVGAGRGVRNARRPNSSYSSSSSSSSSSSGQYNIAGQLVVNGSNWREQVSSQRPKPNEVSASQLGCYQPPTNAPGKTKRPKSPSGKIKEDSSSDDDGPPPSKKPAHFDRDPDSDDSLGRALG